MEKIEGIPKKNIFDVPHGYFDSLPLQILSRVERKPSFFEIPFGRMAVRYALPAIVLTAGLLYFFKPESKAETEELLASISTEHLVSYLNETDITVNELLEEGYLNDQDADSISLKVHGHYLPEGGDLKELKNELENEL